MIIAQITDTHLLAENDPDEVAARRRIADLRAAIAAINALDPAPDMVIHSGDIVHNGTAAEYGLARELMDELKAPYIATVGNKDRRGPFRDAFADRGFLPKGGEFIQYAVDLEGVRLIAGDSLHVPERRGHVCAERLAALNSLLSGARNRPCVMFIHHPPVKVPAFDWPMYHIPGTIEAFIDMASHHPQLGHILCGHTHRADILETLGPVINIMSAVATELRVDSYPEHRRTTPVILVHEVRPDQPCGPAAEVRSSSHWAG